MEIALTYIHGIGRTGGREHLPQGRHVRGERQGQQPGQMTSWSKHRETSSTGITWIEGDLRRETAMNIKRLMDLGCYRGLRHQP